MSHTRSSTGAAPVPITLPDDGDAFAAAAWNAPIAAIQDASFYGAIGGRRMATITGNGTIGATDYGSPSKTGQVFTYSSTGSYTTTLMDAGTTFPVSIDLLSFSPFGTPGTWTIPNAYTTTLAAVTVTAFTTARLMWVPSGGGAGTWIRLR